MGRPAHHRRSTGLSGLAGLTRLIVAALMVPLTACSPLPTLQDVVRDVVSDQTNTDQTDGGKTDADQTDTGQTGGAGDAATTADTAAAAPDPCVAKGTCVCTKAADCASVDPGEKCFGPMYCDVTAPGHACRHDPTRQPFCSTIHDKECVANACDPKTGSCEIKPRERVVEKCTADKSFCTAWYDDGWNGGQPPKVKCAKGLGCVASPSCSNGYCLLNDNFCMCGKDADCKAEEDGNFCNGTLVCKGGKCIIDKATVIDCDHKSDTECFRNTCDPKLGYCAMKNVQGAGIRCDDGEPCTTGETCVGGKCVGGKPACPCKLDADCAVFDLGAAAVCVGGQCQAGS